LGDGARGRGGKPGGGSKGKHGGKPGGNKGGGKGGPRHDGPKTFEARPPRKEKPIDPDNPFAAALMGLKTKK
ncbi:hypothetical protein JMM59_13595, partial [Rhodovulum sulfidophilum]|uniref:hypothetical protein n=1 Tax=Rhodovulum sulfidophilum TaxID=35806 RepID=UPI0019208215